VPATDRSAALGRIEAQLNAIKSGTGLDGSEPFRIDGERFFITNEAPQEVIDEVFETMIRPDRYDDAIEPLVTLGNEPNPEHRVNLGILTRGVPDFQLKKTLDLMQTQAEQGKPLKLSHIWLTTVLKGEFVEELMANPPELVEQQIFGGSPHTILLGDDSDKEIESMLRQRAAMMERYHVSFTGIRSVRPGTKSGHKRWQQKVHGDYDPGRAEYHATTSRFGLVQTIREALATNTRELLKDFDSRTSPYTYRRLTRRQDGYIEDILADWPADEHTIRYTMGKYNPSYTKKAGAGHKRANA
jgi:hypothetical protein